MTPTMTWVWLPTLTGRPMTDGSAPNRRRHKASLRIATRRASPGRSSASVNPRPMTGATPIISKYDAETRIALTRSGSRPSPVSVADDCVAAAIDDSERARARTSANVR